jgi:peptidoglycan/xylan/chitin deacetylase (PgdA/CDA1 family)
MWWAGVAWQGGEFEVAVVDEAGEDVVPPARFTGRELPALIRQLTEYAERSDDLRIVVDSTNGVVDGHLLAAGLSVYRADPPALPSRPVLGSVPGRTLACCGVTKPSALAGLSVSTGTLAGRSREYVRKIVLSGLTKRRLMRAGKLFERGADTRRAVALTFDDGPHPDLTPRVLEILRRYDARATFFCVGINAEAYPELVGRTVDDGHQVGNHTWSHPFLPDLTRDQVLRQVDATNEALAKAAGGENALVRPPYGARTPSVLRWLAGHGMVTALWDVDAGDWAAPGVGAVTHNVLSRVRPGSVVLMHDAGGDRAQTVEALPGIVERLLADGYELVTVDEVTRPRPGG